MASVGFSKARLSDAAAATLTTIAARLYSAGSATAADILAAISAKLPTIGPQTAAASLSVTPDSGNAAWPATGLAKETGGNLATIAASLDGPILGTSVYLAVTGSSAELGADIAAGEYLVIATVDVTFAVTASGGGGSATWATTPGILLPAGVPMQVRTTSAKRIAAIAQTGATGSLMVLPLT